MHYAFDTWMAREFPGCPFERYADDAIVHCTTHRQAQHLLDRIAQRMSEVGLTLHPEKTRIVYCKDGRRREEHEHTSFTFLGYAFRGRGARSRNGRIFNGFLPAISPEALKAKGGYLSNSGRLAMWRRRARITPARTRSCWRGFRTRLRAWTIWSGCAGRTGSVARGA